VTAGNRPAFKKGEKMVEAEWKSHDSYGGNAELHLRIEGMQYQILTHLNLYHRQVEENALKLLEQVLSEIDYPRLVKLEVTNIVNAEIKRAISEAVRTACGTMPWRDIVSIPVSEALKEIMKAMDNITP
jgi:hypothetical protein